MKNSYKLKSSGFGHWFVCAEEDVCDAISRLWAAKIYPNVIAGARGEALITAPTDKAIGDVKKALGM